MTSRSKLGIFKMDNYTYNIENKTIIQTDTNLQNNGSLLILNVEHYNSELVFVDIISIDKLLNYLYDNLNCRYIAFPVSH